MKSFGCCRFVYNYMLKFCSDSYEQSKESFSAYDLIKKLPDLKKEFTWLKEPSNICLQKSIFNLSSAFKNFFRRVRKGENPGYPVFKKKGEGDSCMFDLSIKFNEEDRTITIPKIGKIKIFMDRVPKGTLKSITVSRTCTGKFFASCLYETGDPTPVKAPITKETAVGLDLGLKDFAILSNGVKISNPRYYKEFDLRIKRLQHIESRRKKGSNRRKRIRSKINILYERKRNLVINFIHHTANQLLSKNQTIVIEDLNVSGMMKNHKLAKSIAEACWSEFVRILSYKAEWLGKNIVKIGRFDPSSKICSHCRYKNIELQLSDRAWTCPECGEIHDRDVNAAINILNFGLTKYSPLVEGFNGYGGDPVGSPEKCQCI